MTTTSLLRLGALALAFAAGSVVVAWGGGIENQKSKIENDARPPGMVLIPAGTYVPLQRATNEAFGNRENESSKSCEANVPLRRCQLPRPGQLDKDKDAN